MQPSSSIGAGGSAASGTQSSMSLEAALLFQMEMQKKLHEQLEVRGGSRAPVCCRFVHAAARACTSVRPGRRLQEAWQIVVQAPEKVSRQQWASLQTQ
eukprot:scaffold142747_cov12-Tisochrysis_lutea.AAC.1